MLRKTKKILTKRVMPIALATAILSSSGPPMTLESLVSDIGTIGSTLQNAYQIAKEFSVQDSLDYTANEFSTMLDSTFNFGLPVSAASRRVKFYI